VTFTYQANDGTNDSNPVTVTIAVTAMNQAPVAAGDGYTVTVGETLTVAPAGVLSNDTDGENNPLTAVLGTGTAGLTLNGDGGFTYVAPGAPAVNNFTYRANDGTSNSNLATVALNVVAAPNTPPTAVDDNYAVASGGTLMLSAPGVLSNDTDPEANPLNAQIVSSTTNGTLTLNSDGSFTYVNSGSAATTDTFTYVANDGAADSTTATVTITINATNVAPTATDDSYMTPHNRTLVVALPGVLANDNDADAGTVLAAVLVTIPTNGTLTLNSNGSFTYIPSLGYVGPDSFTYRASDGALTSAPAMVDITVLPNAPPTAVGDTGATNEDTVLNVGAPGVLNNDTDTDVGDTKIVTKLNGSATLTGVSANGAAVTINADGSYSYDPSGSMALQALAAAATIDDTFNYTMADGSAAESTATVTITVTGVNDAPEITGTTTLSYTENDPAAVLSAGVTATDIDAGQNLTGATVHINDNYAEAQDVLSFATMGPISGAFNPLTGRLTLTGADSPANYEAALRTVTYTNTSEAPSTLQRTVTWRVNDGTALSVPVNSFINVTSVNDLPTAVDDVYATTEDAILNIVAPGVLSNDTDPDAGDTKTVTQLNGSATLTGTSAQGAAVTINADGSFSYDPTAAPLLQALPAAATLDDTFFYTMADGSAAESPATVTITVTGVNDPPVMACSGGFTPFTEGGGQPFIDTGVTVSDVDHIIIQSATVTISNLLDTGFETLFTDLTGTSITANYAAPTLTLTGPDTLANFQTVLQKVSYDNTSQNPSTTDRTISFQANDGVNGNISTRTVQITAVNDAPVNALPMPPSVDQDTIHTMSGPAAIQISDVDAGSNSVQVQLTATNGTLTTDGTAGLSFSVGTGTGEATMTFTGTIPAINAALDGMTFTPTPTYFGPASIQIITNDQGFTGTPGAQSDDDTLNITVIQVNQAPVNAVPGAQTFNEDTTHTFSTGNANPISISDPDAGVATVQVQLTVTSGTLTLSGTSGLSFTFTDGNGTGAGDGTADPAMTFRGTIADINSALNGLAYTPNLNFNTADTLTIVTNDLGNTGPGGPKTDTDNVTLNISAVNDAPVVTRPANVGPAEDTVFTFNAGNAISIVDVDAGPGSVTVQLGVTNGTLSLGGLTGISFTVGDGTSDAAMTFSGTLTNVNNALNNMTYLGNLNFNGGDTLTIDANDNGNTGGGGAQNDFESITITVSAVNDAPVNTVPGTQSFNEDTSVTFSNGNGNAISVADVDAAPGNVQVALSSTAGTMTLGNLTGLSFSLGDGTADGSMTFSGTLTNVNNALQGMTFTPTLNINGAQTISMNTSDLGNTGSGGAQNDNDTINLSITAVNDPPVNNLPTNAQSVNEDTALNFTGAGNIFSITDPDAAAGNITVQIVTTNGTTTIVTPGPVAFTGTNGTASYSITGTVAQVNSAIGTLRFNPTLNFPNAAATGIATVTLNTTDNGNTPAPAQTDNGDVLSITVNQVNDPPVVTGETHQTIPNVTVEFAAADSITAPAIFISGNVLSNDNFGPAVEGPQTITISAVQGLAVGVAQTTAQGGSVTMLADGTYIYRPQAGDTTDDSFTYTVQDNGGTANGGDNSTDGVVTIDFVGTARVWFVKNDAPGGGTGISTSPFNTLAAAQTAANAVGDKVFVHAGDGSTTNQNVGFTFQASGQSLQGEAVALTTGQTLNTVVDETLVPAGTRPLIDNTNVTSNGVTIGNNVNVTVTGLSIAATAKPIDLTTAGAGTGSITISNNIIRSAGTQGIGVLLNAGASGIRTLAITGNSWNGAGTHNSNAIDIANSSGTADSLRINISNNVNVKSNADRVLISGGAVARTTVTHFANNSILGGAGAAGVSLNAVTFDETPGGAPQPVQGGNLFIGASGTPVGGAGLLATNSAGNLFFEDLDIYSAAGTGLQLSGTGSFTFSVRPAAPVDSGTSVIDADNGAAVDITNVALDLRLSDLESNTSVSGVALATVSGFFGAPAGSQITKAAGGGTAFSVASSSVTVTYAGSLNVTSGAGVSLTTNTGTMSFTGGMTLSTGANTAFSATGGGTITVTDPAGAANNTITATSGSGLIVTNTNIGASGLTFERITAGTASGSAGVGISLDNTGTAAGNGGLIVTGTGTAGSGGTIQHKTGGDGSTAAGIGIYLNQTKNASFTRMQLNDFENYAIRAEDADGFTLANTVVSGANGNSAAADESAIYMHNCGGTIAISSSNISGGFENNLNVVYESATADTATYNVTATTFHDLQSGNNALVNLRSTTAASSSSNVTFNFGSTSSPALGNIFDNSANQNPLPPPETQWFGDGILVTFEGPFQHTINIDNNTFFELFQAIDYAANFSADVTGRIYNNTITYTEGVGAIAFGTGSSSSASMLFEMLIEDNDIGGLGNDSGSRLGSGIVGDFRGAETARVTIHQNIVRDAEVNPIRIISQSTADDDVHLRISNNTVASIDDDGGGGAGVIPGIEVTTNAATNGDIFLTINANTSTGINEDGILVRQATLNNTFSLEDFAGNGTIANDVDAYLEAQNPGTTARVRSGGSVVNYSTMNQNNANTPAPVTP
jgi:VCBS repeat-containing protein